MTAVFGPGPDFDVIFYFGDSLTDDGLGFGAGQTAPSAEALEELGLGGVDANGRPLGYAGVFSDGPTYSILAPALLGVDPAASGAANFAVGGGAALADPIGALTGGLGTGGGSVNLPTQIAAFLAANGLFDDGGDLIPNPALGESAASLLAGLIDLNTAANELARLNAVVAGAAPPAEGETLPEAGAKLQAALTALANGSFAAAIADSILAQAGLLAAAGVGTIVLTTLPDGVFFPAGAAAAPLLAGVGVSVNDITDAVNANLRAGADALPVPVEFVDLNGLAGEIAADPSTFGFLTLANALGDETGAPALNPALNTDGDPEALDLPIDQVGFFDQVHFTAALHEIVGAFTANTLGDAQLRYGAEDDGVRAGPGQQTVFTEDGADMVRAGRGSDIVFSGDGADTVFGQLGADVIFLGLGDDVGFGGRGGDILAGGSGDDDLFGGRGNDVLAGGAGDDEAFGGRGADLLTDGLGSDALFGGLGADVFVYREASLIGGAAGDTDLFAGGRGQDTLILTIDGDDTAFDAAAFDANFVSGATFTFEALGLTIRNIEEVIVVDGATEAGLALDPALAARIDDADAWGLL